MVERTKFQDKGCIVETAVETFNEMYENMAAINKNNDHAVQTL